MIYQDIIQAYGVRDGPWCLAESEVAVHQLSIYKCLVCTSLYLATEQDLKGKGILLSQVETYYIIYLMNCFFEKKKEKKDKTKVRNTK